MILDIPEAVRDYLKEHSRERGPRRLGEYYPTEIGKCLRQWYLSFHTQQAYDPEKAGVFKAGDIVEDFIGDVITWALQKKEVDVIIPQRHVTVVVGEPHERVVINGKADYLLLLRSRLNYMDTQLVEVKSAASIYKVNEPKKDHVIQVTPYQLAMNPSHTVIVYVEKNNLGHVKQFEVTYNPVLMEWIVNRVRKQHAKIRDLELPLAEARYCHMCKVGLLTVAKINRQNIATCPSCKWSGPVGDTNLWQMNYCPFRGTGKCCGDELEKELKEKAAKGARPSEIAATILTPPEEVIAKTLGETPDEGN